MVRQVNLDPWLENPSGFITPALGPEAFVEEEPRKKKCNGRCWRAHMFRSRSLCELVFKGFNLLVGHGYARRRDGAIVSTAFRWGSRLKRRVTKLVFYGSGTVAVEISCSNDPIPLDISGFSSFVSHLVDIRKCIVDDLFAVYRASGLPIVEEFSLPESWRIVQLHLNRDSDKLEDIRLDDLSIMLSELSNKLRCYYHIIGDLVRCGLKLLSMRH